MQLDLPLKAEKCAPRCRLAPRIKSTSEQGLGTENLRFWRSGAGWCASTERQLHLLCNPDRAPKPEVEAHETVHEGNVFPSGPRVATLRSTLLRRPVTPLQKLRRLTPNCNALTQVETP